MDHLDIHSLNSIQSIRLELEERLARLQLAVDRLRVETNQLSNASVGLRASSSTPSETTRSRTEELALSLATMRRQQRQTQTTTSSISTHVLTATGVPPSEPAVPSSSAPSNPSSLSALLGRNPETSASADNRTSATTPPSTRLPTFASMMSALGEAPTTSSTSPVATGSLISPRVNPNTRASIEDVRRETERVRRLIQSISTEREAPGAEGFTTPAESSTTVRINTRPLTSNGSRQPQTAQVAAEAHSTTSLNLRSELGAGATTRARRVINSMDQSRQREAVTTASIARNHERLLRLNEELETSRQRQIGNQHRLQTLQRDLERQEREMNIITSGSSSVDLRDRIRAVRNDVASLDEIIDRVHQSNSTLPPNPFRPPDRVPYVPPSTLIAENSHSWMPLRRRHTRPIFPTTLGQFPGEGIAPNSLEDEINSIRAAPLPVDGAGAAPSSSSGREAYINLLGDISSLPLLPSTNTLADSDRPLSLSESISQNFTTTMDSDDDEAATVIFESPTPIATEVEFHAQPAPSTTTPATIRRRPRASPQVRSIPIRTSNAREAPSRPVIEISGSESDDDMSFILSEGAFRFEGLGTNRAWMGDDGEGVMPTPFISEERRRAILQRLENIRPINPINSRSMRSDSSPWDVTLSSHQQQVSTGSGFLQRASDRELMRSYEMSFYSNPPEDVLSQPYQTYPNPLSTSHSTIAAPTQQTSTIDLLRQQHDTLALVQLLRSRRLAAAAQNINGGGDDDHHSMYVTSDDTSEWRLSDPFGQDLSYEDESILASLPNLPSSSSTASSSSLGTSRNSTEPFIHPLLGIFLHRIRPDKAEEELEHASGRRRRTVIDREGARVRNPLLFGVTPQTPSALLDPPLVTTVSTDAVSGSTVAIKTTSTMMSDYDEIEVRPGIEDLPDLRPLKKRKEVATAGDMRALSYIQDRRRREGVVIKDQEQCMIGR